MEYTSFGVTGVRASRICFGTFPLGGAWGGYDERLALDTIRHAYHLGINFFDTAQAYGFGRAEELLARALAEPLRRHRDELIVATKGGLRVDAGRRLRDASPSWLRRGLEESLRHLHVDYVDLYQLHWPDATTPIEETAAAMDKFVKEGKVRYVGVSNFDVAQMRAFEKTRKLDSLQPPYSMLVRTIEPEILPYCKAHGIGVMIYGPLAHGLLAGGFTPAQTFPPDDWRSKNPGFRAEGLRRNLEVVEKVKQFAVARGYSVAQLAVAWTLANPAVDVAIVGARRPDQLAETARAVRIRLEPGELEEIDQILWGAEAFAEPTPETV
jgi:aryl-alcohol dehydrogenase-like predicted oxidoreductase